MKAILRSHSGVVREMPLSGPPPEKISMAVNSSGTNIWNPHDLMTGEWSIFKKVEFIRLHQMKNSESWLYGQAAAKTAERIKMSDQKGWTTNHAQIVQLCTTHQMVYGYDEATETKMASIGANVKPYDDESPYDYLTRLYSMAIGKQVEEVTNQVASVMTNQPMVVDSWAVTTQWNYQTPYVPATPAPLPPVTLAVEPQVEPKVVKDLPDPVEPKPRFMKKRS